ncbi:transfer protein spdA [Streptomyces sp. NPDC005385]|uniref:transfer protein spdA n=1 Tax=Streptomyces sp. NPDC005385 TaxID=3157039 RepID=UPI0033B124FB
MPSVTALVRYAALIAAMSISFETQRHLALSHGVLGWPAYAVPIALDCYLLWSVRSGRDIALAVSLSVAANVSGVLSAEPLDAVSTWVAAALHASFPTVLWRMERSPQVSEPDKAAAVVSSVASAWPDADLWQDFEDSSPDSDEAPVTAPPTPADVRAAMDVLASKHGRSPTGRMIADHFQVSERTGRRYMAMAGDAS